MKKRTELCCMRKFMGFTLAEVLITLGIIGVVAAMTLPVLEHHQKVTTVAKLKEVYGVLSQARLLTEHEWGSFNSQLPSEQFFKTYFAPHLKIINECRNRQECYGAAVPHTIGGKQVAAVPAYVVTIMNGAYVGTMPSAGGTIFYVDINGKAQPNLSGRDIFYFYLVNTDNLGEHKGCESLLAKLKTFESGLFPGGYDSCYIPHASLSREKLLDKATHRSCNPDTVENTGGGGNACAALIMKDNWQIAPDYPW